MPSRFTSRSMRYAMPSLLSHYGEQVTVILPSGPRVVRALIERSPPILYEEGGNAYMDDWVIRVTDDAAVGVLRTEITRGQTQVTCETEATGGGTLATKTIVSVESRANGILQLRLR